MNNPANGFLSQGVPQMVYTRDNVENDLVLWLLSVCRLSLVLTQLISKQNVVLIIVNDNDWSQEHT